MTAKLSRGPQSVKRLARLRLETRRPLRAFFMSVKNHRDTPAWRLPMTVSRHYILQRIAAQAGCLLGDLTDGGVAFAPLTGDAPRA